MDRLRRGRRPVRRGDGDGFSNPYGRRRFSKRQMLVLVASTVFLLLLLADGLFVASSLRDRFESLQTELHRGRTSVERGNLEAARTSFTRANSITREIRGLMAHPAYVLARFVPFIALDVHALSGLNDAARSMSRAGLIGVSAGEALGGTTSEELAEAFYSDGRVQLETITTAQRYVARARAALFDARDTLQSVGDPILEAVQGPLDQARRDLLVALEVTERGETLLSALPALFGGEGPRRYFLAFQSPSQARGTGGVIGLYGVLEANGGRVSLTHIGPFVELLTNLETEGITSIQEAEEFRRNYERAVRVADDVNRSPDFPAVSRRLLQIYERSTGRSLDGVLATDPVVLERLLAATGPVSGAGLAQPLTSDNAAEVLLHDAYIQFADNPEVQTRFLTSLIRNFYAAFDDKSVDGSALANALGAGTSSRHLMMYSTREDEQQGLRRLATTGEIVASESMVQHVFHNNVGDNKVDFYLQRSISTQVRFARSGDAFVRTEIQIENGAPVSGDIAMTRSYTGATTRGTNLMDLHVLMPIASEDPRWTRADGGPLRGATATHAGLPSTWTIVRTAPQNTKVVAVEYAIPDATQLLRGGRFSFTLVPQPTVRPDTYSVKVTAPAGFEVTTEVSRGVKRGRSAVFEGVLDRSVEIEVALEPTGV